jgi:predicted DNA-binding ribbon-helix-helix protein
LTVTDRQTSFLSPPRQRVLQVDRKRYSVRLEDSYWHILEDLARDQGVKLSRLVDEVAKEVKGESGLAAALRLRCLSALADKKGDDQAPADRRSVGGGVYGASLENLISANPAPSLLLAEDGRILLANEAFQHWSGVKSESLIGQPYDWFFQLRLAAPLAEIIDGLARGREDFQHGRISYIAPGRVVVANGRVCLGNYSGPRNFTWIVMIQVAKSTA